MWSFFQFVPMLVKNSRSVKGASRAGPSAKRKSSTAARFRPGVENLEERLVPTVLFQPQFGNETRLLVNDYGQTFDGPKLSNTPVHLIFEGEYWQHPTGITADDVLQQVRNVTNSSYLSGVTQYGGNGRAFLANDWKFDTSMVAFPHYLDGGLSFYRTDLAATAAQFINPAEAWTPLTARGLYFVVTPPESVALDYLEAGSYHTVGVIRPFGAPVCVPDGWLGMTGATRLEQMDSFSTFFSHELVEAVTDPYVPGNPSGIEPGVWVTDPAGWPALPGFGQFGEISDFEPLQYNYRLANGSLVQSYWSVKDGAPIVPDGTSQVFTLNLYVATSRYSILTLTVNGDQAWYKNDSVVVDTVATPTGPGVRVTLNGEAVTFDPYTIAAININTGTGADTVNVERLPPGVVLNIHTGTGTDGVNLSPVAKQVDNVAGVVSIYGGGNTTVTVYDSGTLTQDVSYDINSWNLYRQHGVGGLAGTGHDSLIAFFGVSQLAVAGARSNNTFHVTANGLVTPLTLYGNAGTDVLLFDDALNANNNGTEYTVTSESVARVGRDVRFVPGGARFTTDTAFVKFYNLEFVNVSGGDSGNVFNVRGVAENKYLFLNTGPGVNTVQVGDELNTLDAIRGQVTVMGAGTDTLIVNDRALENLDWFINTVAFTINSYEVSRSNTTALHFVDNFGDVWTSSVSTSNLYYFGVANLVLESGVADTTFDVQATAAGTDLSIVAGAGVNNVTAKFGGLGGGLRVQGGGATALTVDDSTDAADHTYTLRDGVVIRDGGTTVSYSGVGNVAVVGGAGQNVFGIEGTTAGTVTDVYAGAGWDELVVQGPDLTMDGVQGALNLHGNELPSAVSFVMFYDYFNTAGQVYDFTANQLLRSGIAPISFDNMAETILYASASAPSTINVNGVAARTFLVLAVDAGDTVNIGAPLADGTATLEDILGPVWVTPYGGNPTVVVDDSADAVPHTVTAARSDYGVSLEGLAPGTLYFNLPSAQGVSVKPGAGDVTGLDAFFALLSPATTTSVQSSSAAASYGDAVTLTATVASGNSQAGTPSGTVTFFDNGAAIGTASLDANGQASLTTASLGAGDHAITAGYDGDGNFQGSASDSVALTVSPAATQTVVSSSRATAVFGQAVTFKAVVGVVTPGAGTPTGTVTFMDGATVLGSATVTAGQATLSIAMLAPGTHFITAVFVSAGGNFAGSSAPALSQVIQKAATKITLTGPAKAVSFGQPVTLKATLAAVAPGAGTPTGTVTFMDGATVLGTGTVVNGVATFKTSTLRKGSHTITTIYAGDTDFLTVTSSTFVVTIV
jgi:hypothetical protein